MRKIDKHFLHEVIGWYITQFPKQLSFRRIGLEKEYPIVNADTYEAADARALFNLLCEIGWCPIFDDFYSEEIIGVKKNGVEITTEAGWCTLEIIMPPEDSLICAVEKLQGIERLIAQLCEHQNMLLLGYGIQPITAAHSKLWIRKRRHEIIRSGLPPGVNGVTITAADQVHLDITENEIVACVNVFNALSGPIIRLFAHSPFWKNRLDEKARLAAREDIWSFAGKQKVGIPTKKFADIEELILCLLSLKFHLARQGADYIVPGVCFADWARVNPGWKDQWKFHEGSTWFDAKVRTVYGTVEIRQACSQKSGGNRCLAALTMGLLENLNQARELVEKLHWSHWHLLKKCALYGLDNDTLEKITTETLKISQAGLKKRGKNEEKFLEPLWKRLNNGTNPAKEAIQFIKEYGLRAFVQNCAISSR